MSAHVVVDDLGEAPSVVRAVRRMIKGDHAVGHVTVQIEDEALEAPQLAV